MLSYTIKRLLIVIPTVIAIAIAIFALLYLTPGDPATMILGETATQEELDAYRAYLGVDQPFLTQLYRYIYRLLVEHDLGTSWVSKLNITTEIKARLPITLAISCYSILIGALFGIPLGVTAAVHQNSKTDKFVLLLSSVMHCIPNYVIAMVLIIVFALHLRWFPSYGIDQGLKSFVLPCVCIFVGGFAGMSRQMRSSMLEVIRSDYVISARAQGYSRRSVYYQHALPNALIPIVTRLGAQVAGALGGTMILETIFAIPGMGSFVQGAITKRDVPIVCGNVIIMAIWFCIVMVVVDLVYAVLDPRIRAKYENDGDGFAAKFKSLFKGRKQST